MNNLEIIKNISLALVSIIIFVGLVILYIKIYLILREIKKLNKKIKAKQIEMDNDLINIDKIGSFDIGISGDKKKYRMSLKQEIQRMQRDKECLLEEISIYNIFKK